MLTIYGSDLSAPANKVRFAANAMGLEYEYKKIDLRAGEHQKPEFLKINPVGKIPALSDDGLNLFESNAIIRYLADKNKSSLYPKDLKGRALVDEWMDFGSMHIGAALAKVMYNRVFAPLRGVAVDENSIKEGLGFLDRFLPVVDHQLGKHSYLTGSQLTLADINLLALLDPCEIAGIDLSKYKNIVGWRNELKEQNFYTRCHAEYGETLKGR